MKRDFKMDKYIQINPADNVGVAIEEIHTSDQFIIGDNTILFRDTIPAGHKFAIREIGKNENVIKYGYPIGKAINRILPGDHVHTQNMRTSLEGDIEYSYSPSFPNNPTSMPEKKINGFLRSNGEMGIRNELWIIPTVGCVNGQAQLIVERIKAEADISFIDDIRVFTHNYGCSQLGDDHINTRKALASLAKHPNAGGVLVMSLGCENNQLPEFKKEMGAWDEKRIRFLIAQEVEDEVETGFLLVKELIENMRKDKREPLPFSKLKVGLKCGGSDGFSGITANPLAGLFSDWLISSGGTTLLTEVPEMFGAETILMNRAETEDIFKDTVTLINSFKNYFRQFGQPIYENPSPGNKMGGITTLEEKSLGCTQKGGTSKVVGVLDYAEPVHRNGLNLLNAPGNDLVAASALALSGCQLVLFTTGRGTPFGSFVPTAKISTNSRLFRFKKNWIDFNAGTLVEGKSFEEVLPDFIDFVIRICNGEHLKHEKAGFKELAIFKTGVTL